MAKHDGMSAKSRKQAKIAKPAKLPVFDENALSTLTEKLDKGLNKGRKSRDDNLNMKNDDSVTSEKARKFAESSSQSMTGKKRDAKGNIKESTTSNSTEAGHEISNKKTNDERQILLQEILALGGTEDDLDLVGDVTSDDDQDGRPQLDAKFTKELSIFVTGLGIDQNNENLVGSESEIGEDDEWEEDYSQSSAETPETAAPKGDIKSPEKDKKNLNRLVSIPVFRFVRFTILISFF